MSIIKHVTLQKIVAHDFRYDPRKVHDIEHKIARVFLGYVRICLTLYLNAEVCLYRTSLIILRLQLMCVYVQGYS